VTLVHFGDAKVDAKQKSREQSILYSYVFVFLIYLFRGERKEILVKSLQKVCAKRKYSKRKFVYKKKESTQVPSKDGVKRI